MGGKTTVTSHAGLSLFTQAVSTQRSFPNGVCRTWESEGRRGTGGRFPAAAPALRYQTDSKSQLGQLPRLRRGCLRCPCSTWVRCKGLWEMVCGRLSQQQNSGQLASDCTCSDRLIPGAFKTDQWKQAMNSNTHPPTWIKDKRVIKLDMLMSKYDWLLTDLTEQ